MGEEVAQARINFSEVCNALMLALKLGQGGINPINLSVVGVVEQRMN